MPVHFYDPHYGGWPCAQAFDCSLPALATAHDAVSQKSVDFSHPSSVSSSLTWGTLCCWGFRKTFRKSSENFFRNPLFAYLGDEESFYMAFSPLINAKTLQN